MESLRPVSAAAGLRQRPERAGHAREEQEQHEGERHSERQRSRGQQRGGLVGEAEVAASGDAEGCTADPGVNQVERRTREVLPIEAGREQQEEGGADDDVPVARSVRFEQLQRAHHDEQRRAGVEAIHRAELRDHGDDEQQRDADFCERARQPERAQLRRESPAHPEKGGA